MDVEVELDEGEVGLLDLLDQFDYWVRVVLDEGRHWLSQTFVELVTDVVLFDHGLNGKERTVSEVSADSMSSFRWSIKSKMKR